MKFFLSLCYLLSFSAFSFVVLIDPGHGGAELGAVNYLVKKDSTGKIVRKKILEKDLALKVAKKIKDYLKAKHTVYLTRSFDRKLTLEERAKMADTVKADLFISVHFNSSESEKYSGFETYYLDNNRNKAINKVERIENHSISEKDKVIHQILIDLVIQKTASQSKKLAKYVHKSISRTLLKNMKIKDRGIKPGLFYVLALSKRPGILLEGGFVSNQHDLDKINSNQYIDRYAHSVSKGIESYLSTLPQKDLRLF